FLLFLVLFQEWLERSAVSFVEAAEQLIIFQTKYLNTHDQALNRTYKYVSKNDDQPVDTAAVCGSCEHQYNLHHCRMADSECADTDKGKCVGKITQQDFKQFEKALYEEHDFSGFRKCILLFLHKFFQWFFQENSDQRNHKHDHQYTCGRECMARQIQNDGRNDCSVKYQTGNGILIKKRFPFSVRPQGVDDMEDHRHKDQEHAKGDRHDEYRVHLADQRQGEHRFLGIQPQGGKKFFKSEEASVQESEKRGKDARQADDRSQCDLPEFIKERSADHEAQSLPHVAEHGAEDKRIGQSHKDRRVHLVIRRKAVHLNIH